MKKYIVKSLKVLYFVILSILLISIFEVTAEAEVLNYDREEAIRYAERYCSEANTVQFKEFTKSGCPSCKVDCANFASQSTMAGFGGFDDNGNIVGNLFSCVKGAPTISKAGTTKGITLARELGSALTNSFCFKEVSLADAKDGDVITFQNNSKKNKDNPTGTVHSGILNKDVGRQRCQVLNRELRLFIIGRIYG
jgi:hypothetical protein